MGDVLPALDMMFRLPLEHLDALEHRVGGAAIAKRLAEFGPANRELKAIELLRAIVERHEFDRTQHRSEVTFEARPSEDAIEHCSAMSIFKRTAIDVC